MISSLTLQNNTLRVITQFQGPSLKIQQPFMKKQTILETNFTVSSSAATNGKRIL